MSFLQAMIISKKRILFTQHHKACKEQKWATSVCARVCCVCTWSSCKSSSGGPSPPGHFHTIPDGFERVDGRADIQDGELVRFFVNFSVIIVDDIAHLLAAAVDDPVVTVKGQLVAVRERERWGIPFKKNVFLVALVSFLTKWIHCLYDYSRRAEQEKKSSLDAATLIWIEETKYSKTQIQYPVDIHIHIMVKLGLPHPMAEASPRRVLFGFTAEPLQHWTTWAFAAGRRCCQLM